MRYKDLDSFIASLELKIRMIVPNVVAETAVEFFKERFQTKEWDGNPWPQTKRVVRKGSLLVRKSELVNSIRPSLVAFNKVRISAGNENVPYAKVHNEGGTLHPKVTPAMRRWAWAQAYKAGMTSAKSATEKGLNKSTFNQGKSEEINFYRRLAMTKKTQLDIVIPMRKFMGHSDRLNEKIHGRIVGIINE
jgi:phage gpG-like protein